MSKMIQPRRQDFVLRTARCTAIWVYFRIALDPLRCYEML
jgi:hypothetical protein